MELIIPISEYRQKTYLLMDKEGYSSIALLHQFLHVPKRKLSLLVEQGIISKPKSHQGKAHTFSYIETVQIIIALDLLKMGFKPQRVKDTVAELSETVLESKVFLHLFFPIGTK